MNGRVFAIQIALRLINGDAIGKAINIKYGKHLPPFMMTSIMINVIIITHYYLRTKKTKKTFP